MKELMKKLVTALEEKASSDLISMAGLRSDTKIELPETTNTTANKTEKPAGMHKRKYSQPPPDSELRI
jgi:hypothetical protein